jgi:hypothetical protein
MRLSQHCVAFDHPSILTLTVPVQFPGVISASDLRGDVTGQSTIRLTSTSTGARLVAYVSYGPIPGALSPYNRTDAVNGYIVDMSHETSSSPAASQSLALESSAMGTGSCLGGSVEGVPAVKRLFNG